MLKVAFTIISFFTFFNLSAQTIPNDFTVPEKSNENHIVTDLAKGEGELFNNLNHPLSITGGALILAGTTSYIIGSESLKKEPIDAPFLENYSPQTNAQYIGASAFLVGAILFTIFSTERSVNIPKNKKQKKYNASDWDVAIE